MTQTLPRLLYLLAVLACYLLLMPNPVTIFMAACLSCLTLPQYRRLRQKARAWRMKLDNGLELELGRDEVGPRLDRFVAIWRQELSRLPYRMEYVDLRYPNGFAVKMPDYVPGRQPARPAA